MDRRSFFKIVATTGAAAVAGGCGQSAQQLIPYVIPPDNIVPGVAAYFASVCRECPSGCGVLAKNRDGRSQARGQSRSPVQHRRLCVRGRGAGAYHPDRFRGALSAASDGGAPRRSSSPTAWRAAEPGRAGDRGTGSRRQPARLMDGGALGARPRIAYEPLA
jgi:molybdopterin-containing oxidoreductase family iron-sulfur binding subunit